MMMGRSGVWRGLEIFFNLFFDEEAFADGDFEGEGDDEGIHFVEFAMVRPVDHPVAEELDSLAEIVVERSVDYFLVASC